MSKPTQKRILSVFSLSLLLLLGIFATPSVAGTTALEPLKELPPTLSASTTAAVNTTTSLEVINSPTQYGDTLVATARVRLDSPVNLSNASVIFELNGVEVAETVLIYAGNGEFTGLIPLSQMPSVGSHSLIARFEGLPASADSPEALASESAPLTFSIAAIPTNISFTSVPASAVALSTINVTAELAPSTITQTGSASLFFDGVAVSTAPVIGTAPITFANVPVPADAQLVGIKYSGDQNFEPSQLVEQAISVTQRATSTTSTSTQSVVLANDSIRLNVRVATPQQPNSIDPTGSIVVFVDGLRFQEITNPLNVDAVLGNSLSEYLIDVPTNGLSKGRHAITVHFVPDSGFADSTSAVSYFDVQNHPTRLSTSMSALTGTPSSPARLWVHAALADSGQSTLLAAATGNNSTGQSTGLSATATVGTVQAFVGSSPIGSPVSLNTAATLVSLEGLPVGSHTVELRFVPSDTTWESATASVSVVISEDLPLNEPSENSPVENTPNATSGSPTANPDSVPSEPAASTSSKTPVLADTGANVGLTLPLISFVLVLLGITSLRVQKQKRSK